MKRRFLKLFFSTLIIFSFFSFAQNPNNVKVFADYKELENSQLPLNCKWDYIDSSFVDPGFYYANGANAKPDGCITKRVWLPYGLEGNTGYATYHCRVENLKSQEKYSMVLYKSIYGSADVFVNGKCVYKGNSTSGISESGKNSKRHVHPITFSADKKGVVDLVIHVSNYDIHKGGILLVPRISTVPHMDKFIMKNIGFEAILAGVLLILGFYNLIIFFLNKSQRMYLFLALLSFDLVITACTIDFSLLSYFSFDWLTGVHFKIALISLTLIIPLYNLYAVNLYGIKFKWNWIVLLVDFFVPLFFILCPIIISSRFVLIAMVILYVNSLYLCWLIFKNARSPRVMYTFNIVIIILMLCSALYGLFIGQYESEDNSGILLFKTAIMIFAISQSSLAGIKRDLLFKENRNQLIQYEKFNDSYKRFVPEAIMNFLQVENVSSIKDGDNVICDGMILACKMNSGLENISDMQENIIFELSEEYYEGILNTVKLYGGFFSKTAGKSFVVSFTDKSDNAVRCAVAIQKYLAALNSDRQRKGKIQIKIDMAIHSTKIAIGIAGNELHLVTAQCSSGISDAMQICNLNKILDSNMLITEQALDFCRGYSESLFEGVIVDIQGVKTLIYKIIPFDNSNTSIDYSSEEDE